MLNSEGDKPMGKNMRALKTCDGGTLEFDGKEYDIKVGEDVIISGT